ncbi:NAD(P)-dependent oxidoreductase [Marinovum sp. 2_MG-2023]|uniref:NAD-dependent epimerase/dehydratase family protein n=1 Tax=unclassified Marinovum TaxID=2647166 RepID=UPI0026E249C8|nr:MULTISPECIES: NAD(P)-dependent oxidoreductase [unclassified Marinovum]MDO6730129.1 NAD(P)-dependent oxidoreductase [Marinovum sp. 2_MG-2023]MDO6778867.1 NAD(P)-dependent oxidoreductase [Marinovum sp. 1_MG-2023]
MDRLTLLITGAAGYVGRHTVAEARARGHAVIAVVRNFATPKAWQGDDGITVLACDLSEPEGLNAAIARADVVLHLAASMSGDAAAHARDTIAATTALLDAMPDGGKLVQLSSMAVYDMSTVEPGEMLDESAALLTPGAPADAYALAKGAQEKLVADAASKAALSLTILRAGAVFGPGRLWNAHLGFSLGPVLIRLGSQGQIPLCHISTCAAALVSAAERPATGAINVLDEDLPDRRRYLGCLKAGPKLTLPFSWRVMMPLALMAARLIPEARLPGLLRPSVLRTRYLPIHFDNSRMRRVLGLRQAKAFETLMHEAQE